MASKAYYGSYTSADNEVNLVTYSMSRQYSQRGKRITEIRRLRLHGELIYSTPDLIIAAANNIINSFKQDYKDFVYTVGGTEAHSLRNSGDCISGVKVVGNSFPHGSPEQLATTRTFWVDLEATYDACDDDLVSWWESIRTTGTGGPWWVVVNEMAGVQTLGGPVAYQLAPTTIQQYVQRGRAVGYTRWPDTPGPVNPQGEFAYKRDITQESARQMGKGLRFWPVSWTYYMVRDVSNFGFGDYHPTSK